MKKINAFTLAEVLITLGIIGVVSAITMPIIVEKHQKVVTITALKKFYTSINQAVKFSILDNGDVSCWTFPASYNSAQDTVDFLNKYFAKYVKHTEIKICPKSIIYDRGPWVCIYYADGSVSAFNKTGSGFDIAFYVNSKYMGKEWNNVHITRYVFPFTFYRFGANEQLKSRIEPYDQEWDGSREHLLHSSSYGCLSSPSRGYCGKLIQYDGWVIKDDYPW